MELPSYSDPLQSGGFAFVGGRFIANQLRNLGFRDWEAFAASWNDLDLDTFMADGGRYRQRRHAAFLVSADAIVRMPNQSHYQSRDYNPLNGGVERWFAPVTEFAGDHCALMSVLRFAHTVFNGLTRSDLAPSAWHVEVHQIRITAQSGQPGLPTPEGAHRDGVDWVLVMLVARHNAASGATTILDAARRPIGHFVLTQPLDTALVDDSRVFHGVTPIEPIDSKLIAQRDVLVVTFRRSAPTPAPRR